MTPAEFVQLHCGCDLLNGYICSIHEDIKELLERIAMLAAAPSGEGNSCEDEGCPHYGTPHSHI